MGPCLVLVLLMSILWTVAGQHGQESQTCKKLKPSGLQPCGDGLQPCGDGFCCCNETVAKCVEHYSSLSYIPRLNRSIVWLNFSSNYLENITGLTFKNISTVNITFLVLRYNNVKHITFDAFVNFTNIHFLDLKGNHMVQEDLFEALYGLRHTKIRGLNIGNMSLTYIDKNISYGIPRIRYLNIGDNNLNSIDCSVFRNITRLQNLTMLYNRVASMYNVYFPQLHTLNMDRNKLTAIPGFCKETINASLRVLLLNANNIEYIPPGDLRCFLFLHTLSLKSNKIKTMEPNLFSSLSQLNLLYVDYDFAYYGLVVNVKEFAFNNSKLQWMYARHLNLIYPSQMNEKAFKGCHNMRYLNFEGNLLNTVNDAYLMNLFGDLRYLQNLILSKCQIRFVPKVISEKLTRLTTLNLNMNRITTLEMNSFHGLKNLTKLFLADNYIFHVNSDAFPPAFRRNLFRINMTNNPFNCTCDNLWFITWMKRDHTKFQHYPNGYKCQSPPPLKSTLMKNAPVSEERCLLSTNTISVIISITGFIVVLSVVLLIAYRWRSYTCIPFRYLIHMLRYKKRNQPLNDEDVLNNEDVCFTYDAFVIFCDEEFPWVRNQLMPKMEDDAGLKLCVHQRDFLPGKYIVDNIIDSLEHSRKVVLVLSNTFCDSSWCDFELTLVQKRALDQPEGYLVVILKESLRNENMTASLFALLQTTTYIMWPEEEEDREMFWERVRASIGQ